MKNLFIILFLAFFLQPTEFYGQILFTEDCFVGGVLVVGANTIGAQYNIKAKIKWDSNNSINKAYVMTYRQGLPKEPFIMYINSEKIIWSYTSIIGNETQLDNPLSELYATHVQEITNQLILDNDTIIIDLPEQNLPIYGNMGWWGMYIVILYESPFIVSPICHRIYITDQQQDKPQLYHFLKPTFIEDTPVALGFFTARLDDDDYDATAIVINNDYFGKIWGSDLNSPPTIGTQGHYYYQNSYFEGLNGDTANDQVWHHDAIMKLNSHFSNNPNQSLGMYRIQGGGSNYHPAFVITYTPTCSLPEGNNMERTMDICSEQSPTGDILNPISLQAIPGYDHYAWTPAKGLSDSTIANPICTADSSRWYRVSMWNDDGNVCDQTIPVFVTVNPVPRPAAVNIKPSICPSTTGLIDLKQPAGKSPFEYFLNGEEQPTGTFDKLAPGSYNVSIQSAAGCTWDSTIVIPLNPVQKAAFTANPTSGYTPLRVVFLNKSKYADGYTWLINNEPFATTHNNMVHTFEEPGDYEVALVAYRQEESCTDTAVVTIKVFQGLSLIIPNIITPNNDGYNDALVAQTAGVEYMRWEVFNRWGNLLHSGEAHYPPTALTLWNPEQNEFNNGTYTVVITARGDSGEVKQIVEQILVRSTE